MRKPYFLLVVCCLLLLNMTSFSFLAPILPDLITSRDINLSLVGFIFSFYPLSYFIFSIYLGKSLHLYEKRKLLIYCQLLLVFANFLFGILDRITSNYLLVILSIISRLVQGFAIGGACSILYAYVPELYPKEQEETFAIIEMSVGAGISIGPVLGGFIYKYVSYEASFFIIAGIYALFSWIFISLLKSYSGDDQKVPSQEPLSPNSPMTASISMSLSMSNSGMLFEMDPVCEEVELSYRKIFKNKAFLMTFFVYCVSYTSITLIQPTFSDHIHSYGFDSDSVGMLFALCDLAYALTSLALIKLFRHFKRKHLFVFGGFLTLLSLLLLGPEEYTFLPRSIDVVCVGMTFFGISQVFYNATIIPEFIDILIDIYGSKKVINDMGSGMYNAGLAVSEFCGPLLGGILSDLFGFSRGLTVYSFLLGFYLVIYAVFVKRPPRNSEKVVELEKNVELENNGEFENNSKESF